MKTTKKAAKKKVSRKAKSTRVKVEVRLPMPILNTLIRAAEIAELDQEVVVLSLIALSIAKAEEMSAKGP